ncbi:hypothetical protein GWK47_012329 [Chionoecetes opilio]|uniref:Uncharacterized protein n=1 Tax=Chionoecetes opilio TaxID=41210 RepID=A0A8J4XXA2_CHIOP|nr:hypothetical protein GWK47_012329 [Chionoecetes opilio]
MNAQYGVPSQISFCIHSNVTLHAGREHGVDLVAALSRTISGDQASSDFMKVNISWSLNTERSAAVFECTGVREIQSEMNSSIQRRWYRETNLCKKLCHQTLKGRAIPPLMATCLQFFVIVQQDEIATKCPSKHKRRRPPEALRMS